MAPANSIKLSIDRKRRAGKLKDLRKDVMSARIPGTSMPTPIRIKETIRARNMSPIVEGNLMNL